MTSVRIGFGLAGVVATAASASLVSRLVRDRARAEREVTDLTVELREVSDEVDAMAARLFQVNSELAKSNHTLEEFGRAARHDLRSPLRAIFTLVGFVLEDFADHLPDEAREHLAMIDSRARRMDRLVGDLLTYAQAGDVDVEPSVEDPDDLLDELIATVGLVESVELGVEHDCGPVEVARSPMMGCLLNLVDNACKHNERSDASVRVGLRRCDSWLRIVVTDNGPGIAPEHREKIFEPLHTLRSRDEVEGSGIGLSIVRRTVEAYGGTVDLESEVGVGSTFTVSWPLA